MNRKKQQREVPDEVIAVLDCSPNLVPCKKFCHANICRMADHLNEGKYQQCIAFFRQTVKELRTMQLLAAWRKSRNN